MNTIPMPLIIVASGSNSGSAYGAQRRIARWPMNVTTAKAIMSTAMVEKCWPLSESPTLRKANATTP